MPHSILSAACHAKVRRSPHALACRGWPHTPAPRVKRAIRGFWRPQAEEAWLPQEKAGKGRELASVARSIDTFSECKPGSLIVRFAAFDNAGEAAAGRRDLPTTASPLRSCASRREPSSPPPPIRQRASVAKETVPQCDTSPSPFRYLAR